MDNKIVGMGIVLKASELSFENDKIPYRQYYHNFGIISVTITIKRQRNNETTIRYTLAKGPGDTRYNTSFILRTRYHVSTEFTEW